MTLTLKMMMMGAGDQVHICLPWLELVINAGSCLSFCWYLDCISGPGLGHWFVSGPCRSSERLWALSQGFLQRISELLMEQNLSCFRLMITWLLIRAKYWGCKLQIDDTGKGKNVSDSHLSHVGWVCKRKELHHTYKFCNLQISCLSILALAALSLAPRFCPWHFSGALCYSRGHWHSLTSTLSNSLWMRRV